MFYCQLEMWDDSTVASGLALPVLKDHNLSLLSCEQWNAVLDEWELYSAWRNETVKQGLDFTSFDSSSGSSAGLIVPEQPTLG